MKHLLLSLAILIALSPTVTLADAGGAGQGAINNGEIEACADFNCACSWRGRDMGNDRAPTSASECTASCEATVAIYNTANDPTDGEITATYQCLNADGEVINAVQPTVQATITPAKDPIIPCLNVPIPGLSFGNCTPDYDGIGANPDSAKLLVGVAGDGGKQINLLGLYVEAVYQYLLIAGAIVAVTMLMIAGLQYATARGESKQVEQAKKRINNAIVGIILLLLAYNIAFIINPATTTFEALTVNHIDRVAYVQNSGDYAASADYTQIDPPEGVICDPSASIYDIAQSMKGHVTYRLGGKGGPAPYPYDKKLNASGEAYGSFCPPDQICLDCSGYAGYVASCKGLTIPGVTGGTKAIFTGAEKATSCNSTSINGVTLNPGDVVGFPPSDATKGYGHVMMYIGNGKISDSSGGGREPGRAVKTQSMDFACGYMNDPSGLYVVRLSQ